MDPTIFLDIFKLHFISIMCYNLCFILELRWPLKSQSNKEEGFLGTITSEQCCHGDAESVTWF